MPMTLEDLAREAQAWMQQMMAEAEDYDRQSQGVDQVVSGNAAVLRAESFARGLAVQKLRDFLTRAGLMDGNALERKELADAKRKAKMEHINRVRQGKEPPNLQILEDEQLYAKLNHEWVTKYAGGFKRSAQPKLAQQPLLDGDGNPIEFPVSEQPDELDELKGQVAQLTALVTQLLQPQAGQ